MILHRVLYVGLAFTALACASGQSSGTRRPARDNTLLAGAELQSNPALNLYDQIRRLRPNWLRTRGPTSLSTAVPDDVVVYRDGVRQGGSAILRDFTVQSVESVRFLSGPEAASRFGLDHEHGAILVTTRTR